MTEFDYGLEDKILRQNIPGRYSGWDKDDDEEGPRSRADWVDRDEAGGDAEAGDSSAVREGFGDMSLGGAAVRRVPPKTDLGPVRSKARAAEGRAMGGGGGKRSLAGPKGVIQDYRDHQDEAQRAREAEAADRKAVLHRIAHGAVMSDGGGVAQGSVSFAAAGSAAVLRHRTTIERADGAGTRQREKPAWARDDSEEEEGNDGRGDDGKGLEVDSDDEFLDEFEREMGAGVASIGGSGGAGGASGGVGTGGGGGGGGGGQEGFMREFRERRLRELRAAAARPVFGEVAECHGGGADFLAAVDAHESDPSVAVVVHVYDDALPACRRLNVCLESLARRWTHVRFLRLKASDTPGQGEERGAGHRRSGGGDEDEDEDEEARTGRSWRQWRQRGSGGGGGGDDEDDDDADGSSAPAATQQTAAQRTSAFDEDTLPVLIVYRGGEVVGSVVRATDELATQKAAASRDGRGNSCGSGGGSELFGADDVEWLLSQNGAIQE